MQREPGPAPRKRTASARRQLRFPANLGSGQLYTEVFPQYAKFAPCSPLSELSSLILLPSTPPLHCILHNGRDFHLFCLLIYPQDPECAWHRGDTQ